MDGHDGVAAVVLPGEQGAGPQFFKLRLKSLDLTLDLLHHGIVIFFICHLDQDQDVLPDGEKPFHLFDQLLKAL